MTAIPAITHSRKFAAKNPPAFSHRFVTFLVTFSRYPTPIEGFVDNKGPTPIRPNGRPSGRRRFLRYFDLEPRCFFLTHPNAKFTLWLLDKLGLILAECRRLIADC